MSCLIEFIAQLTEHRDRDQLEGTFVRTLAELLQAERVELFIPVGDPGDQRWLLRAGLRRGEVPDVRGLLWVDVEAMPTLDSVPARRRCLDTGEPSREPAPAHGGWLIRFALKAESRAEAVVEVYAERPLDIAGHEALAPALRVYRNMLEMLDYSERDTLTGLFNRKSFDDMFYKVLRGAPPPPPAAEDAFAGQERRSRPAPKRFWLAVMDIDHFKQVNDRYGHLIGDEVLLLAGRLLRESFRIHDRVYRFGGEEFVVLLRCPDEAAAQLALERFRVRMEAFAFPQAGRITASLGFTALLVGDSPSDAFERADEGVYYAKRAGRNQVASRDDLVRRQLLQADRKAGDVELF